MPVTSSVEVASWSGRIAFGAWWLLYSGPVGRTERHAHHAFQIVVHAGGPLLSDGDAHLYEGPVIVIPPDAPHAFRDEREHVLVVYIDPECSEGLGLRASGAPLSIRPKAQSGCRISRRLSAGALGPSGDSRESRALGDFTFGLGDCEHAGTTSGCGCSIALAA